MQIWEMTRDQFFDLPELVESLAKDNGVVGEQYDHFQTKKGRYTGKITKKNKPLNNMDLFNFGKVYWIEQVKAAINAGLPVPSTVIDQFNNLTKT